MKQPRGDSAFSDTWPARVHAGRRGRPTKAQARALTDHGARYRMTEFEASGQPVMVEVGFGMGHALAHFAGEHRDWACIGIEVYRPGIGSLILQCETLGLDNVRIVEGDAVAALARWPSASVRLVAVYFPDPWPKRRHGKRRLIQPPFLGEVARLLEPGGRLLMATDWEPYARSMLTTADAEPALDNEAGPGNFSKRPAERPETHFEARGRACGRAVWNLAYAKAR